MALEAGRAFYKSNLTDSLATFNLAPAPTDAMRFASVGRIDPTCFSFCDHDQRTGVLGRRRLRIDAQPARREMRPPEKIERQ